MRLKIELPATWKQYDNPDGPATFCRARSSNHFQVSWAEYRGRKALPEITADSLERMATDFGRKNRFGKLVESSGGECRFGQFGTAVYRSDRHARVQVWFVSDGRDHIMATHMCEDEPPAAEVAEAQQIAISLALGSELAAKPWWKFW
jgi:hypothetical protein